MFNYGTVFSTDVIKRSTILMWNVTLKRRYKIQTSNVSHQSMDVIVELGRTLFGQDEP